MNSPSDAVLAILAGGAGSRMGRPKALLQVHGRPILEYLLDRFAWPGPTWLITAPGREHPPGWQQFDVERVDPSPGMGPLRGILTALEHPGATEVVVCTVDMPALTNGVLQRLIEELRRRPRARGLMFRRGDRSNAKIEPFPSVLRASAAAILRRRIEAGQRSVRGLIDEPGFVAIPCPSDWPQTMWLNLNEPADLSALADLPG